MNPIFRKIIDRSKLLSKNIYSKMPHFFRKQPPHHLGRWNSINLDENKKHDIAEKASYDHCGPCSNETQYIVEKKMRGNNDSFVFYK